MSTLIVELGDRSYPIYIGQGIYANAEFYAPHISGRQIMVVSNETVAPLYLNKFLQALQAYECHSVILPDGEQYKTLTVLNKIFDGLLESRCSRSTTIMALGGGVIGDMSGFAAACYQRGVPFIQVPTTLLAQVDSSVGGKTAVNHPLGKNMIGAFYQPLAVIIDTATLDTLDDRQFRAGVAEVVKYGIIRDQDFFDWLEKNIHRVMRRDPEALSFIIERSCQNKAEIVAADETETGLRAILNLGHTFGHAIETGTRYDWLHGEAVAAGMCMAAQLSEKMGWLTAREVSKIVSLIAMAGLPTRKPAGLEARTFLDLMAVDKKVHDGKIRLVLLQGIGNAIITSDYDQALLERVLSD